MANLVIWGVKLIVLSDRQHRPLQLDQQQVAQSTRRDYPACTYKDLPTDIRQPGNLTNNP